MGNDRRRQCVSFSIISLIKYDRRCCYDVVLHPSVFFETRV